MIWNTTPPPHRHGALGSDAHAGQTSDHVEGFGSKKARWESSKIVHEGVPCRPFPFIALHQRQGTLFW